MASVDIKNVHTADTAVNGKTSFTIKELNIWVHNIVCPCRLCYEKILKKVGFTYRIRKYLSLHTKIFRQAKD